jgi:hypothetical protein
MAGFAGALGALISGGGEAAKPYNMQALEAWQKTKDALAAEVHEYLQNPSLPPDRYNEVAQLHSKLRTSKPGRPDHTLIDKLREAMYVHPENINRMQGAGILPTPPPLPKPAAAGPGETPGAPGNTALAALMAAPAQANMLLPGIGGMIQPPPPQGPAFAQPSQMPQPIPIPAGASAAAPASSPVQGGAPIPLPTPAVAQPIPPPNAGDPQFPDPMKVFSFPGQLPPALAHLQAAGMTQRFNHEAALAQQAAAHRLDEQLKNQAMTDKIKLFEQNSGLSFKDDLSPNQQLAFLGVNTSAGSKPVGNASNVIGQNILKGDPRATDVFGSPIVPGQTYKTITMADKSVRSIPTELSSKFQFNSDGEVIRVSPIAPLGEAPGGTTGGVAPGAGNYNKPVDTIVNGKVERVMVNNRGELPDGTRPALVSPLNVKNTSSASSEPTPLGGTVRSTTTGKTVAGIPGSRPLTTPNRPNVVGMAPSILPGKPDVPIVKFSGTPSMVKPEIRRFNSASDPVDAAIKVALSTGAKEVKGNAFVKAHAPQRLAELGLDLTPVSSSIFDRSQLASGILHHIDEIDEVVNFADKNGTIGPIASRWNRFLTNTVGKDTSAVFMQESLDAAKKKYQLDHGGAEMPTNVEKTLQVGISKAFSTLTTGQTFLASAVSMAHGGARGGSSPPLIEKWHQALQANDAPTIRSQMKVARNWMEGYKDLVNSASKKKAEAMDTNPAISGSIPAPGRDEIDDLADRYLPKK